MEELHRRHGDMFTVQIANEGTWVFLAHPDAVKQVFTGDPRLLHAGEANRILLPLLGHNSVLLLDDTAHMRQRKLLLAPFHGERMRGFERIMREAACEEIERLPLGVAQPLRPATQRITLDIITRTVFGVQDEARRKRLMGTLGHVLEWGGEPRRMAMLAVFGPRSAATSHLFRGVREPADRLIYEEIRERRGAADLAERDDILSMLLSARHDDGSPMSDEELRDELMTLLVAGHETTASALAWAVERLVRHPGALQRLREEAEGEGTEYADAVCKETLRLRPILSLVVRRLKEPMEIGGRLLPAGVTVAPCIYLVHRRPEIYPEPLSFRPERFLEQQAGTYSWFPFGGGVRRCLGASFALFEMRIVLQELVTRLDLRAARPEPERFVRRAITNAPRRGGEVVARRRIAAEPTVVQAAA
jgi:cytochrome P450 family 135